MKKKKWMRIGIALALSVSMTAGAAAVPAVAEASTGSIIGAIIGGAVAASEMNKQIKYYNTTEEGRQELFKQLQEKYGVYYRYDLNTQLDRIFTNLTAAIGSMDASIYDRPYNYFINKEDSFNAFCTLGHNMSVNVGLYSYLTNEDEIAVVLAHEMGHGQKDHPAKGMKKSLGPAVLASATGTVLGAIAANIWSGRASPSRWSGRRTTSRSSTSRVHPTTREQPPPSGRESLISEATTLPTYFPSWQARLTTRRTLRAVTTTQRSSRR